MHERVLAERDEKKLQREIHSRWRLQLWGKGDEAFENNSSANILELLEF
jgi:hypothetical protein